MRRNSITCPTNSLICGQQDLVSSGIGINISADNSLESPLNLSQSQPQSILRNEFKKVRHYSNHEDPSAGSAHRAVTFDKSIENNSLKLETQEDEDGHADPSTSPLRFTTHTAGLLRNRRTSLPVSSASFLQNNRSALQQSQKVNEARGIVMDLLVMLNASTHMNTTTSMMPIMVSCLRAVASLLNPALTGGGNAGSLTQLSELGLPSVIENPYSGEILSSSVG
uniref:Uncharacterized protein n=1 Tax=Ditylenchus dipsaci TaxID=166011 RepID=A0A915DVJ9_9BILA